MRGLVVVAMVGIVVLSAPISVAADVLYELRARTFDTLSRGTVEFEENVVVSVKGDRMRQEVNGTRSVLTRRGARYQKPGHHVTLDQLDRGLRYEINLDAATYVEESFATLRQRHEEGIAAAEKALGVNPGEPPPSLRVSVDRAGERHQVNGRECERVVLKSTKEIVLAASRGVPGGGAPSRFSMTFDLCIASDTALTREARAVEDRIEEAAGMRGALPERELRIFGHRRDIFAVFELMRRLMEQEQQLLGGIPLRWERVFVGPRRDQPQATLVRQSGEVTRIEDPVLDASRFDLPPGLKLDRRGALP